VYRVIRTQQCWDTYHSYRYAALLDNPPVTRETELTEAGIAAASLSTMASSNPEGNTLGTSVYCGMARGGHVIWVNPVTPHLARTRVAHCVPSSVVRLMLPGSRRTRVGRGSGLGYTPQLNLLSMSTKRNRGWGTELDDSLLGPTITRITSVPRTTR